ncbi:MAG TPA: type II toxin-antitoxin system HicA family toxin [Candidatus Dojkabacteria bacterium]|jgi:predicted RNA binding protein YcfA (HicA-like mRNA interferase family)
MSKLYSSKYIISILVKNGFNYKSQKGSHVKLIKARLIVIIPHPKKEIPLGTFKSILRQSKLDPKKFKP